MLSYYLYKLQSQRYQVKNIDTNCKLSNKRNNQNAKDKRQDYNMK